MKKVLAGPLATVKRGIPVLQWLPLYDAEKGISDLIAGITVALTLIPQSIAYAALAGLGPEVSFSSAITVMPTDVALSRKNGLTYYMLSILLTLAFIFIFVFVLISILTLIVMFIFIISYSYYVCSLLLSSFYL